MAISNQIIDNLVNLTVNSAEFKKNLQMASIKTLRLAQKENISNPKRKMIDEQIHHLMSKPADHRNDLVESDQTFDFENNMTETEAREKHAQLKNLSSVMRSLLLEIRDRKGYLALGFSSFEEYGEKEWGYSRTYINRLAKAEEVQKTLTVPIGTELPESQLRELAKIPEAERTAIYEQAKAEAEAVGKEVTAKLIREKADLEKQLKSKESTLEALNARFDDNVKTLVEHKISEKQIDMQKNLDEIVAKVEAENQATIDNQKDKIAKLENDLAKIKQTSCSTERDERYLHDLKEEIDEARAALKTLTIDQQEADAAKKTNHAYTGIAKALANDVDDHITSLQAISNLVSEDGGIIPLYELNTFTKDYLLEVAKVLRNSAKELEKLANYSELQEKAA